MRCFRPARFNTHLPDFPKPLAGGSFFRYFRNLSLEGQCATVDAEVKNAAKGSPIQSPDVMVAFTIPESQKWLRHFSQATLAEEVNKVQRPVLET